MRSVVVSALAGMLILAVHLAAPYLKTGGVELVYNLRAPNGRPGFAAVFSAWSWWSLTGQTTPVNEPLSADAEGKVRAEINAALALTPHNCTDRWLLVSTTALDSGAVALTGFCASQTELEHE